MISAGARRFCILFLYLNSFNGTQKKKKKLALPPFFLLFIMLLQERKTKYHILPCFNQTFQVPEKYTFVKEIGQGAYGVVWQVKHVFYFL